MPSHVQPPAQQGPDRVALVGFVLALLVSAWALTRSWNGSLRDAHESRQFQTALTVRGIIDHGFKLAYETPLLGPPWSVPMEFPTYQLVVASAVGLTSLPLESAGRLVSIAFFLAALPALHLLLRDRLPRRRDTLVVIAFVLTGPIYLFYSRTFMIESTALCLALWFLVAFERALAQPRGPWLPVAWMVGVLAATTKITTFAVFCPPAVVLTCLLARARQRSGLAPGGAWLNPLLTAALIAIVPVAAGFAWVAYTDAVKSTQPYAQMLTSTSLRAFNFGPPELRFSGPFWQFVGYVTSHQVSSLAALLLAVAALPFVERTYRHIAFVCLALFSPGFLVFSNLYFVHDYYYYASGIFLLTALGTIAAGLLRNPRLPKIVGVSALTLGLGSQVHSFRETYHALFHRQAPPPPPALATLVREVTAPEEILVTLGLDWNGLYPYAAERRAIMVFASLTEDFSTLQRSVDNLGSLRPGALIVAGRLRAQRTFLEPRLDLLGLAHAPAASHGDEDLYVRSDRHPEIVARLRAHGREGVTTGPDSAPGPFAISGEFDLTTTATARPLIMISPHPVRSRGEDPVGIVELGGTAVAAVQAPTEIIIQPTPGSTQIEARGGLMPNAYQNGNLSDGITMTVAEERPNGLRTLLYQRTLDPRNRAEDRTEVHLLISRDLPFTGRLIFGLYPGPRGDPSYDWGYWRSITVR